MAFRSKKASGSQGRDSRHQDRSAAPRPGGAASSGQNPSGSTSVETSAVDEITQKAGSLGISSQAVNTPGATRHTATDRGIQTTWDIWPARDIGNRRYTKKKILGKSDGDDESEEGSSDEEDSDEDSDEESSGDEADEEGYTRSKDPVRDYRFGTVIEMRLVPPSDRGSALTRLTPTPNARYPGGGLRAGIRRFTVIQAPTATTPVFKALPIKTYNGRGVAAPGVVKSHHAIIYTRAPPTSIGAEQPQRQENGILEAPMRTQPILVIPDDRTRPLDPMSRLDFFDITEFDTSIRDIKVYGRVEQNLLGPLHYQFQAVWAAIRQTTGQHTNTPFQTQPQQPAPPQQQQPAAAQQPGPSLAQILAGIPYTTASGMFTSETPIHTSYVIAYDGYVRLRAEERELDSPAALDEVQIQALATDPQRRSAYLQALTALWAQ